MYIVGGENCLLRCLSVFLCNKQTYHNIVRKNIVSHVIENWENYENFIVRDLSYNIELHTINYYENFMLTNGSYSGGFTELYNIKVYVYFFDENTPRIFGHDLFDNVLTSLLW